MVAPQIILVTGGAGFIGGHFVRRALERGQRVVNVDALTYAADPDALAEIRQHHLHLFVRGSICDGPLIRRLLHEYRPQVIVNFAAETHVDRSIDGPSVFLQTNAHGVLVLLEAAREYLVQHPDQADEFRFVQVSTDEVFGSIANGKADDTTPYAPSSPYAASKAAGDHLARAWFRTYAFPAIITWCGNNYGPRQFPEKLIPLTIARALCGMPLPVYGTGRNVRDWIHVVDHCRALEVIVERGEPGSSYPISADDERENIEVVKAICAILDVIAPRPDGRLHGSAITPVADRPGHDQRYALNAARLLQELGWRPTIGFAEGLADTIQWYLDHHPWLQRIASTVYSGERLGQKPAVKLVRSK